MPLTTGNFPPVDPATFMQTPYRERIKTLSRHWAEYGFGAPKITMVIYIVKLLFFYVLGGVLVATLTSGLDPLHPAAWWDEPIVYQKARAVDGAARDASASPARGARWPGTSSR